MGIMIRKKGIIGNEISKGRIRERRDKWEGKESRGERGR
jgi:hypothetical protein